MGEISELLPCPLCSEEMTVFKDSFIHPANDHCPLNCAEFPLNQATVSGWNRRAEARQAPLTGTEAWSYTINYGPDGEENYANVYTPDGEFVGNLKIHHARAIVGGLNEAAFAARPAADDDADEAYEIGKRDGYEEAVQDIDQLTGGDGEYRFCADGDPERHCPDAATMKAQIAERFAARPAEPVAVKVKPLEWRDHRGHTFPDTWTALSPLGGVFEIEERSASDSPAYVASGPNYVFIADKDSLDAAKAAAQADYEQRIRSALVSAPQVQSVVERLRAGPDVRELEDGSGGWEMDADKTGETMREASDLIVSQTAEVERLTKALQSVGKQAENAAWNIGKPGHKFTAADIQAGYFNILDFVRAALASITETGGAK